MDDYFSAADPYLQQYKTQAERATKLTSEATTLPDLLKKALDEKLANQPIVQERATAASNFLASLGQAPQTVTPQATGGVVLTPTEQASLISGRRALALQPLLAANQRYDLLSGTIADIIGQASRAATAQAQEATGGAEISRNLYTDVIDRIYKQKQLESKGGGTSLSQLLSMYRLLKPTSQQEMAGYNAQSGLAALEKANEIVTRNPSVVLYRKIPGFQFFSSDTQQFDAATREMADVFTRLRTGAALNLNEITTYEQNKPQPGDDPATIKYKFSILGNLYRSIIQRTQVPDLATFLSTGLSSLTPSAGGEWEVISP